jgi:DNA polymerase-3 subunit delta
VTDASRFDGFDLVDAALTGDAARVCRVLHVLEEEGVGALGILGQLTWSIRNVARDGTYGMPPQRARLIEAARRRLRPADIEAALALAATVDRQVKGAPGDPWRTLETLALHLAGVRLPL